MLLLKDVDGRVNAHQPGVVDVRLWLLAEKLLFMFGQHEWLLVHLVRDTLLVQNVFLFFLSERDSVRVSDHVRLRGSTLGLRGLRTV